MFEVMRRPIRTPWVWVLLTLVMLLAACAREEPFRATVLPPGTGGGEFELTSHTGQRVRATDFNGKVALVFFGYSHCPDICSPALVKLAEVLRALGPDASRVQVLFITVDPAHDTPAQLAAFVPKFHPAILGLTGSPDQIAAAARAYRAGYQPEPGAPARFVHTGGIYIRDPRGTLRLYAKENQPAADLEHDVRRMLRESGR